MPRPLTPSESLWITTRIAPLQRGLRRASQAGRWITAALGVILIAGGLAVMDNPWILILSIFFGCASIGYALLAGKGGATEEEIDQELCVEALCGTCQRVEVPMGESSISVPTMDGLPLHVPKHWNKELESGQVYDLECVIMDIGSYLNAFDTVAVVVSIEGFRSMDAEIESGILEIEPDRPGWLGIGAFMSLTGLLGLIAAESTFAITAVLLSSLGLSASLCALAILSHRRNSTIIALADEASENWVRTFKRGS